MKFEVFDEKKVGKEEPVRLALKTDDGGVGVMVVDEDGFIVPGGYLVCFKPDGTVHRCTAVSPEFGFQLDVRQRIELSGE